MGSAQAKPALTGYSLVPTTIPQAPAAPSIKVVQSGGYYKLFFWLAVVIVVGMTIWYIYGKITGTSGTSGLPGIDTKAPVTPLAVPADGKTSKTIDSASLPIIKESDYAIQFWINVADWEYKYGSKKSVLIHEGTGGVVNPSVYLHPTDNKLGIDISVYPPTEPAVGSTTMTADIYTTFVDDIPIQTWTSVAITIFQRNMDIYFNGKLVKSVVLSGIPKPAAGNIVLASGGGFSGSVCDVTMTPVYLSPIDAESFYAKGSSCVAQAATENTPAPDSLSMKLFGYTFEFDARDKSNNVVRRYTW